VASPAVRAFADLLFAHAKGMRSLITLGALNEISGIRHGFFTRQGGVSSGLYATMNCGFGSGDDPGRVAENRRLCAARLDAPADRLVTAYQVHSARAVRVTTPWLPTEAPEADGLVTTERGLALGILTADCAPLLFADAKAAVIGAAHAGWRGALSGIIEATVRQMVEAGAKANRIVAAIGPCIAQRSYEVGPDFPAPFLEQDKNNGDFFAPSLARPGHFMFDLTGYVARRVGAAGVPLIQRCPNDTMAEEDRFFSYRRATLRGEKDYGRCLSAIVLP